MLPPASRPHLSQTSSDTPWIPGPVADRPWTSIFLECPSRVPAPQSGPDGRVPGPTPAAPAAPRCLTHRPSQGWALLMPHIQLWPSPALSLSRPSSSPVPPLLEYASLQTWCSVPRQLPLLTVSCSADHEASKSEFKILCDLPLLTS